MNKANDKLLSEALANVLPEGQAFKYHHASTLPASCPALFSPPPGRKPEKTYCETHLLHVSISPSGDFKKENIAIFAIELYIYTTAKLTTIFVSKADSTGYVPLLDLPPGASSVIKAISSTFISWLVRNRTRSDRPLVLSLFARAQEQYLYPGSAENKAKHVLDDRQLVKWWCRTLDPVLREYPGEEDDESRRTEEEQTVRSQAYLIVPGQDKYETVAFYPQSARSDPPERKRWKNGDPLRQVSSHPSAPPRCLVPHFPDDPKTRFIMELDEELQNVPSSQQVHEESPSKRGNGHWKSVRTLEQFWDMMAFRQECSSGRLTGFLWIVFRPDQLEEVDEGPPSPSLKPHKVLDGLRLAPPTTDLLPEPVTTQAPKQTPKRPPKLSEKRKKTPRSTRSTTGLQKQEQVKKRKKAKLRGPVIPRAPRVKESSTSDPAKIRIAEVTDHYFCPIGSRGTIILDQRAYNRVHEILCRLDYATRQVATASTAKWIQECSIIAGQSGKDWGVEINGRRKLEKTSAAPAGQDGATVLGVKRKAKDQDVKGAVTTLNPGMIRKKTKGEEGTNTQTEAKSQEASTSNVKSLSAGLIRKKAKTQS